MKLIVRNALRAWRRLCDSKLREFPSCPRLLRIVGFAKLKDRLLLTAEDIFRLAATRITFRLVLVPKIFRFNKQSVLLHAKQVLLSREKLDPIPLQHVNFRGRHMHDTRFLVQCRSGVTNPKQQLELCLSGLTRSVVVHEQIPDLYHGIDVSEYDSISLLSDVNRIASNWASCMWYGQEQSKAWSFVRSELSFRPELLSSDIFTVYKCKDVHFCRNKKSTS